MIGRFQTRRYVRHMPHRHVADGCSLTGAKLSRLPLAATIGQSALRDIGQGHELHTKIVTLLARGGFIMGPGHDTSWRQPNELEAVG